MAAATFHVVQAKLDDEEGKDTQKLCENRRRRLSGQDGFAKRKKYRDVQQNPRAAFVVDDVASVQPSKVGGIEIRSAIEIVPTGGSVLGPGSDPEMSRLRPKRIDSWGIDGTMMQ
jgi:hypothetical protein